MDFKFKVQKYQTDAVEDIANVFEGQPFKPSYEHNLDVGTFITLARKRKKTYDIETGEIKTVQESQLRFEESGEALAYCNAPIALTPEQLLKNIQDLQRDHNIEVDASIDMRMDAPSFDIEMETGTGKTYVYTKAMFELNKRYGWSKFIIVVPSVAIREGVKKSLEFTEEHFFRECGYEKKILSFIYSSNNFNNIDSYSQSDDINVMIINQQAFSSLEKNKYFQKQDNFGSRRPSDVVKDNHPIVIIDEPQKILGKEKKPSKTADILKNEFGALFFLHFSATHEVHHNLIYRLDALDAYNQRLVKKLQVADVHISNATGRSCYIYVSEIIPNGDKPPRAKIEIECSRTGSAPQPEMRTVEIGYSLYDASNENPLYQGVKVTNINMEDHYVEFDGLTEPVYVGEYIGKAGDDILRRLEIRTTIEKHLIKEQELFKAGIKCLSLFFIDKVVKYRDYDQEDLRGEYCRMFDEEYKSVLAEKLPMIGDEEYVKYLKSLDPIKIRDGYFSIDSKGRMIDSKEGKSGEGSDDESAYQRILVNKKDLITYNEDLRFIFTHSALREGWDNPNIFQICTLKHPDESNNASRRQEVGRGMRICVDKDGNRMDYDTLGEAYFHTFNTLTIITEEQFKKFYDGIQSEIAKSISRRPIEITPAYFAGKTVLVNGEKTQITETQSQKIYAYLVLNDYLDGNQISQQCRDAISNGSFVKPSGPVLDPISDSVTEMIKALAENRVYEIDDGHATMETNKPIHLNKPEFRNLWDAINHKFVYHVDFKSEDLITKSIAEIDRRLEVPKIAYEINTVTQKDKLSQDDLVSGTAYGDVHTDRGMIKTVDIEVKYDLVGEIASKCSITRKTVVTILEGIYESKFQMYQYNPAEFISRVSKIINDVKSDEIVNHIHYDIIDGSFKIDLFKQFHPMVDVSKATPVKKNVHEYILAASEVEANFAKQLDESNEVEVYAKLPDSRNSFYIPTPLGNYSPDWAIAFKKNGTKHLFFVAETKGDMNPNTRSAYENQKIECAKVAYGELSPEVGYDVVKNFDDLWQKLHAEE